MISQFLSAVARRLSGDRVEAWTLESRRAMHLEKLLQQGEPVEPVAPDLITALLNAHEIVSSATVTRIRIETLLSQLDSAGHTALAILLREELTAKLTASKPRKRWWKFGR